MSNQPEVPKNRPAWIGAVLRNLINPCEADYLSACVNQHCWLSIANAIEKKCSDEGRVHFRYGIEDEPEFKEYEEAHWQAAGWAVIAKKLDQ